MVLRPVFVTARPEKAAEARRLGFDLECRSLDLPELQAVDPADVVEAKARAAHDHVGAPILVEDSGLVVEAWGGFPGALIKWLEQTAGVAAIVRMLDGFPDRTARAVCAVAYYDGEALVSARGEVSGSIAPAPRGAGGFGWDSIFVPEGGDRTFAEMSGAEKDRVSHRRRAWEALAARIPSLRAPRS